MKIKPHITRRSGMWVVLFVGEDIYEDATLTGAFQSAKHVWRYQ